MRLVARLFGSALVSSVLLLPAQPALAQFVQLGDKLIGTGAIGPAGQGQSVALSGDGTTAIVGGPADSSSTGAAWVYIRNGGLWSQQAELVGNNAVGSAREGWSVALSADGNTAIVGGRGDNGNTGAAWVFIRNGGAWTQQGAKLVANNAVGGAQQGWSAALSADGNTAVIGGPTDNSSAGAAWVFIRSGGVWTQQAKLVGNDATASALQGRSVAISGDGNTAIVGGDGDNNGAGAAWVFTRSGGTWTQQGNKLVGTGGAVNPTRGWSVALSADSNTAMVGAPNDNGGVGAAWVFTRSGGTWTQQGNKLVGTGATLGAGQGWSVALSADGNTAIVGGPTGNSNNGQAWVFTRSGGAWSQLGNKFTGSNAAGAAQGRSVALSGDGNTAIVGGPFDTTNAGAAWVFVQLDRIKLNLTGTHDFDGNLHSDIAWRHSGGSAAAWLITGSVVPGSFGVVPTNWQLVGQRDFNNDAKYDWLWRDGSTGTVAIWLLNGLSVLQSGSLGAVPGNWVIAGTSDFNYDGRGDILWRDSQSGMVAIWLLDGLSIVQSGSLGTVPGNWVVAATDGKGNIFWRDSNTGAVAIWQVYGFEVVQTASLGVVPLNWTIAGVGDFDGNGSTDILWRDGTGTVAIWLMNGLSVAQSGSLGAVPSNWSIAATGDFGPRAKSDILWRDSNTGTVAIWFVDGLQISSTKSLGAVGLDWTIQGLNAD